MFYSQIVKGSTVPIMYKKQKRNRDRWVINKQKMLACYFLWGITLKCHFWGSSDNRPPFCIFAKCQYWIFSKTKQNETKPFFKLFLLRLFWNMKISVTLTDVFCHADKYFIRSFVASYILNLPLHLCCLFQFMSN